MEAKGYLRNHPFLLGEKEDGEDYLSTDDLEMIDQLAPMFDEYYYLKSKEEANERYDIAINYMIGITDNHISWVGKPSEWMKALRIASGKESE